MNPAFARSVCQPRESASRPVRLCMPLPADTLYLEGDIPVSYCRLPREAPEELAAAIAQAPHYAALCPYAHSVGRRPLRLLLVGEQLDTARQGAAYLAAARRGGAARKQEEEWAELDEMLDLPGALCQEEAPPTEDALLLCDASLLAPGSPDAELPRLQAQARERGILRSFYLRSEHLFFSALTGEGLTEALVDFLSACKADLVALAVQPHPRSRDLIRRLCFEQDFRLCRLGTPTASYQEQVFHAVAKQRKARLADSVRFPVVLEQLRRLRGPRFSTCDFPRLLDHAMGLHGPKTPLTTEQLIFRDGLAAEETALERLDALVGLEHVKRAVRQMIAEAELASKRVFAGLPDAPRCRHLAFSGAPGTCKSITARLLARALQESGAGSGAFVEAGREQLIGTYVGQTSPMVAELFRRARGGVLFLDEAGALLSHGDDPYAIEAVNALVRHMELSPETIVIFATYPGEMDRLLGENPGLSSRVARVLSFPSYETRELCDILAYLAEASCYRLPEGWRGVSSSFFDAMRRLQGDRFGNGREARRLLNEAIGNLAQRAALGPVPLDLISGEDLRQAADTLLGESRAKPRVIGF